MSVQFEYWSLALVMIIADLLWHFQTIVNEEYLDIKDVWLFSLWEWKHAKHLYVTCQPLFRISVSVCRDQCLLLNCFQMKLKPTKLHLSYPTFQFQSIADRTALAVVLWAGLDKFNFHTHYIGVLTLPKAENQVSLALVSDMWLFGFRTWFLWCGLSVFKLVLVLSLFSLHCSWVHTYPNMWLPSCNSFPALSLQLDITERVQVIELTISLTEAILHASGSWNGEWRDKESTHFSWNLSLHKEPT